MLPRRNWKQWLGKLFFGGGWGGQTRVADHLQKGSGKSGWKVNGTRLSGSFQRKISGSNRISEKVVLFFWTVLMFHFFKAIFYTSFRLSLPFFGKCRENEILRGR